MVIIIYLIYYPNRYNNHGSNQIFSHLLYIPIDSPFKEMCKGFKFDNKFTEVRNGEIVEVKWSKGESKMDRIANCEMFGEGNKKFWKQLWTGNLKFDNSKVLTSKIKFEVPKGTKLPTFILLRTWGVSDKGPQCTIVT